MGVTKMGKHYDVIVVGAGPAGAMAAAALANADVSTLLVERETFPRYKTCGGGVTGRALEHLPAGAEIDWDHECFTVQLNICELNLSFDVERGDPVVCMTMRDYFDQALIDVAKKAGAE
ncbi:MAG: FAD-dependent monooxygenase, partial [Myxococcota bacterium]